MIHNFHQVETSLNQLCLEYDQLMILQQIYDFIPSFQRWQALEKNIHHKIHQHEKILEEITGNIKNQTSNLIVEKIQLQQQRKIEEATKNISNLRQYINEQSQLVELLSEETCEQHLSQQFVSKLSPQISPKMNEYLTTSSKQLAELKTFLEIAQKQTKNNLSSALQNTRQIQILKNSFQHQNYEYDKILHEIQIEKMKFTEPPLKDFHNQILCHIVKQIEKIQKILYCLQDKLIEYGSSDEYLQEAIIVDNWFTKVLFQFQGLASYSQQKLILMKLKESSYYNAVLLEEDMSKDMAAVESKVQRCQQNILKFKALLNVKY